MRQRDYIVGKLGKWLKLLGTLRKPFNVCSILGTALERAVRAEGDVVDSW